MKQELDLSQSLSSLKGIGPKRKSVLLEHGIATFFELLTYFPRRYLDRNFTKDIILKQGDIVTLLGTIADSYIVHGKKSRLLVGFRTLNNERINLVFFRGVNFFHKIFTVDRKVVISGKLEYFKGYQIVHPEYEFLSDKDDPEDSIHAGRIIPLYPSTEALKEEGLDSKGLRKLMFQVLEGGNIIENLPSKLIKKRSLIGRDKAFHEIHFPETMEAVQIARKRFAYEEFFYFQRLLLYKQRERQKIKRMLWPLPQSPSRENLEKNLPFELTEDQKLAVNTILSQTSSDSPAAFLLQGDVGSGKTITALLIALHYIDNHIQVVFLAPTEILARQHYQTIYKFMGNMPFLGIELLLGGENKKTRSEKLARIKTGESNIIIGTHSLLQEDVAFSDLGLVVIDEQHKFGVDQRETIRSKGKNPDILAMTATPIPRTLCLTLYGDLTLVNIKTKPKGRKPIDTRWYKEDRRNGVYNSIRKYVSSGRQCYIVYPLVEESEKVDLESCTVAYENLSTNVFPDLKIGLLHGKMKSADKDSVMEKFKSGEIQILVTTTVVEVGVDVPNATILVVEHADRFGISQLHQLRGRVGRSDIESFCILMTGDFISDEGRDRLEALVASNDGYYLAEKDLAIRGPGELLGVKQSGLPEFKIADLVSDRSLLDEAKEDASSLPLDDPNEAAELSTRFSEGKFLFAN
ncbi:ATP-dependent DNA helicase RecG [Leptospira sp. 2 VSF19]|uniref:ATP-dependent DNA helicase RecG n=1 Tax=Leptospira soteropolitanensis TaxID=2950025 RepID=A0AAW5VK09_9LEPT|nr:ATP-dependent DNA helicase RecG [Leptospira soteropolitanensis]MCW7491881.1 ATP-dependent DNA helicase RecG [Leptospira soteropolitanensis]MCW7499465.1 ATP-dependent DNA helicase RecG [Leptospira soteropolitanensis]MCW7520944.1 ATP-dependent DNA helicase RecG [Leptospira soteropolitanensis]MCW7525569.1 ATP-dependent DNA helicase RecG [Leptospira soteropolitanensis]MCW7529435.1 ATP-dependent DNA helicase RecG [Leptospira soteropolitanensis]